MATAAQTPGQRRLLSALKTLRRLQGEGRMVVRTADLTRLERESLVSNGFLAPVAQGWYMPTKPGEADGDSTCWYAAARDFIGGYCDARFGDRWCVSADLSVRLHAGETSLPRQVSVQSPSGQNGLLKLPWGCSIVDIKAKDFPSPAQLTRIGPLRAMKLEHALVRVPQSFYHAYPRDAQIALAALKDPSDITRELLDGGHSVVAGRLAGALRAAGRGELADDVLAAMRQVGYAVTESNPFEAPLRQLVLARGDSPYVARVRLMWEAMRAAVLEQFPPEPGTPTNIDRYLGDVEDVFVSDAYHSLSIEGYRVTDELIERVARGDWNPEAHKHDADARSAMAAHGYWLAHNAVKDSMREILAGANSGRVAQRDHRQWYRQLFAPSVDAGILRPADLAGYRGHQVFIRNAAHVPPPVEAVRDMMPVLFELLEHEPSAAVRAVLGHFVFVFIHPYMDGNGRMGRFLMNGMLASGGFPWTVLRMERREEYMSALNSASSEGDITPLAHFIATSLRPVPEGRAPGGRGRVTTKRRRDKAA